MTIIRFPRWCREVDWLNATVWCGMGIWAIVVWWFLIATFAPMVGNLLHDAGSLNGCEALTADECAAFAQGGL